MNARDELAELLDRIYYDYELGYLPNDENLEYVQADAVLLSGWRKMPSREGVARWVWRRRIGPNGDESFDYLIAREARGLEGLPEGIWAEADAILALMDRGQ